MNEILELLVAREEELVKQTKEIEQLQSSSFHHSARIETALKEAVSKIDPDNKQLVVEQLLGILNQVPQFVSEGFTDLQNARISLAARIDEIKILALTLENKAKAEIAKAKADEEFLEKVKTGEITEESITGPREPGVRPESLAKFRKLTEELTKAEG